MSKPIIDYWFPIRGRAEGIKLTLSLKNVEWEMKGSEYKNDLEHFPFAQCPRYIDKDVDLVQSNTILRYLARKYDLNGSSVKDVCRVDMIMEGVESLRSKYLTLIYDDELAPEAKAKFWATHGDKSTAHGSNAEGAHLEFLANMLRRCGSGYFVGSQITMGDIVVFDIVDLLSRIFPEEVKTEYPELMAHHQLIGGQPQIKAYRASERWLPAANANNLG